MSTEINWKDVTQVLKWIAEQNEKDCINQRRLQDFLSKYISKGQSNVSFPRMAQFIY
jgi:hypothetical protein